MTGQKIFFKVCQIEFDHMQGTFPADYIEIRMWTFESMDFRKQRFILYLVIKMACLFGSALLIRNESFRNNSLKCYLMQNNIKHRDYLWGNSGSKYRIEQSVIIVNNIHLYKTELENIIKNYWFGAGNGLIFMFGFEDAMIQSLLKTPEKFDWSKGLADVIEVGSVPNAALIP